MDKKKEVSRQFKWQQKQKKLGNCIVCGKKRHPGHSTRCTRCRILYNAAQNRRNRLKRKERKENGRE